MQTSIQALIEDAQTQAGGLRALARTIGTTAPTLIQMRNGDRPANYKVRARLRVVLGEQPARAYIAAVAEDLAESDNAMEKEAAAQLLAVLSAFPQGMERAMGIEPTS